MAAAIFADSAATAEATFASSRFISSTISSEERVSMAIDALLRDSVVADGGSGTCMGANLFSGFSVKEQIFEDQEQGMAESAIWGVVRRLHMITSMHRPSRISIALSHFSFGTVDLTKGPAVTDSSASSTTGNPFFIWTEHSCSVNCSLRSCRKAGETPVFPERGHLARSKSLNAQITGHLVDEHEFIRTQKHLRQLFQWS